MEIVDNVPCAHVLQKKRGPFSYQGQLRAGFCLARARDNADKLESTAAVSRAQRTILDKLKGRKWTVR